MSTRRRLLFAVSAVLIALIGLEACSRLAEPWLAPARSIPLPAPHAPGADPREFRPRFEQEQAQVREGVALIADDRSGWALPPSSSATTGGPARIEQMGRMAIRINTLGIRGPEVAERAPGEVRLLSLGDSSIFGVMVAERCVFSSVAAADMQRALLSAGRAAPVVPFIGGVPGYDSAQSLQMLRRIGPVLKPDWVIVGNIWSDVFRRDDAQRRQAQEQIAEPMRGLASWRVLRSLLSPWLLSRKVRWIDGIADVGALDDEGIPPRMPLQAYMDNLRAMDAEARTWGGRTAWLILPAPMDFDARPPPETVIVYREAMRRVAEEVGAPVIAGPEVFTAHGGLGYFEDHVHPSQAGHTLLGHAAARALLQASGADPEPDIPWEAPCE